ncbi:MAG: dihydrolipoyl dehydrogenase [Planctomycetota bacterium]|jgi:dihydrolipoamide dehydrogenase|nr:dihydrolipoyl dehydrogenase [Planctomycetota bacterium]
MRDLIIIGGGPAGYVAADRAAALGKSVLLAERDRLGGVCLNSGCVPTKAFLNSAKLYRHALHSQSFGVSVAGASLDYAKMLARTGKIQETLRGGVAGLLRRRKVEVLQGEARILDAHRVQIGDAVHEAANLLIATGSRPVMPPIPGLAGNAAVLDAAGLLAAPSLAESITIIGGGVIGVEFAFFHALLDKKAVIIEMLPQICGNLDKEIAAILQRKLESLGVAVHLGARVEKIADGEVVFADREGKTRSVKAERILAAAGRAPNLEGFGLENLNLDQDRKGIRVDGRAATSLPGVYAAGDVSGRFQLAHFASRQGTVAVNNMFGQPDICRETAVPGILYTDPEAATVGLTEAQAKASGLKARTLKMPLAASGRFLAETEGERGLVKAVLGGRDELLGLQVIGPYASEMIGAACVMIENEMRARDIREIVFPHPTVAEIMKEAMFL